MLKVKGYDELPISKEGNTPHFPGSYRTLFEFVNRFKPKTILEVGFNAGHSACCFLNASPDAVMYTFDICNYGTEEVGVKVLQKYFNTELIQGDSKETLPNWLNEKKMFFDLFL